MKRLSDMYDNYDETDGISPNKIHFGDSSASMQNFTLHNLELYNLKFNLDFIEMNIRDDLDIIDFSLRKVKQKLDDYLQNVDENDLSLNEIQIYLTELKSLFETDNIDQDSKNKNDVFILNENMNLKCIIKELESKLKNGVDTGDFDVLKNKNMILNSKQNNNEMDFALYDLKLFIETNLLNENFLLNSLKSIAINENDEDILDISLADPYISKDALQNQSYKRKSLSFLEYSQNISINNETTKIEDDNSHILLEMQTEVAKALNNENNETASNHCNEKILYDILSKYLCKLVDKTKVHSAINDCIDTFYKGIVDRSKYDNNILFNQLKQVQNDFDEQKIQCEHLSTVNLELENHSRENLIQIKLLEDQLSNIQQSYMEKEQAFDDLQVEYNKISEERDFAHNVKEEYIEHFSILEGKVKELTEIKEELQNKLFESEKLYEENCNELKETFEKLKLHTNSETMETTSESDKLSVEREMDRRGELLKALETKLSDREEEFKELLNKLSDMESLQRDLEESILSNDQLANKLEDKLVEIEMQQDTIRGLEEEVQKLSSEIDVLTAELDDTNVLNRQTNEELTEKKLEIDTLNSQLCEFEENINLLNDSTEELRVGYERVNADLNESRKKYSDLEQENTIQRDIIEAMEEDIRVNNDKLESVKALEDELTEIKSNNMKLEEKLHELNEELSILRDESNESECKMSNLIGVNNDLQRQCDDNDLLRNELLQKCESLETQLENKIIITNELEEQIKSNDIKLERFEEMKLEIDILKESKALLEEEFNVKENNLDERNKECESLKLHINELSSSLDKLNVDLEESNKLLQDSNSELERINLIILEKEEAIKSVEIEMAQREELLKTLENKLSECEEEFEHNEVVINQLKYSIDLAEQETCNLKRSLDEKNEKLEKTNDLLNEALELKQSQESILEELKHKFEEVNQLNEQIQNDKRDLQEEINALKINTESYQEQIEKLSQQLIELSKCLKTKDEMIMKSEMVEKENQDSIKYLKDELLAKESQINAVMSDKNELENNFEDISKQLNRCKAELESYQEQIEKLSQQLIELSNDYEDSKTVNDELSKCLKTKDEMIMKSEMVEKENQDSIKYLKDELLAKERHINAVMSDKNELENNFEDISKQLTRCKAELESYPITLQELTETIVEKDSAIKQSIQELNTLRVEINNKDEFIIELRKNSASMLEMSESLKEIPKLKQEISKLENCIQSKDFDLHQKVALMKDANNRYDALLREHHELRNRRSTDELENELRETNNQLMEATRRLNNIDESNRQFESTKSIFMEKITELNKVNERLQRRISEIESSASCTSNSNTIRQSTLANKENIDVDAIKSKYQEEIEQLKKQNQSKLSGSAEVIRQLKEDLRCYENLNVEYKKLKDRYIKKRERTNQMENWCKEKGFNPPEAN